uniref:Uncharacterized protein n=1 Tax=Steinernema glaseri TaxID=37863 RepID=A0A1I7ZZR7_9BILA
MASLRIFLLLVLLFVGSSVAQFGGRGGFGGPGPGGFGRSRVVEKVIIRERVPVRGGPVRGGGFGPRGLGPYGK